MILVRISRDLKDLKDREMIINAMVNCAMRSAGVPVIGDFITTGVTHGQLRIAQGDTPEVMKYQWSRKGEDLTKYTLKDLRRLPTPKEVSINRWKVEIFTTEPEDDEL